METLPVVIESESPDPQGDVQPHAGLLLQVVGLLHQLNREVGELRDHISGRIKPYYTVDEVAELVGRSAYTVRRWVSEGRLQAIRVDGSGPKGRLLIARDQLTALIQLGHGENISSPMMSQF
jgi:excisionase family DNA binding protein